MPLNNNQLSNLKRGVNKHNIEVYQKLIDDQESLPNGDLITIETFRDWGMSEERISTITATAEEDVTPIEEDPIEDDGSCDVFNQKFNIKRLL